MNPAIHSIGGQLPLFAATDEDTFVVAVGDGTRWDDYAAIQGGRRLRGDASRVAVWDMLDESASGAFGAGIAGGGVIGSVCTLFEFMPGMIGGAGVALAGVALLTGSIIARRRTSRDSGRNAKRLLVAQQVIDAVRENVSARMPNADKDQVEAVIRLALGTKDGTLPAGITYTLDSEQDTVTIAFDHRRWPRDPKRIIPAKPDPWRAAADRIAASRGLEVGAGANLLGRLEQHLAELEPIVGTGNAEWTVLRDERVAMLGTQLLDNDKLAANPTALAKQRATARMQSLAEQADILMLAADRIAYAQLDHGDRSIEAGRTFVAERYGADRG